MSLISVIIPCFKLAHFLPEAIASVLAQTHQDYEIVVVDDGSPDDTEAVARRYAHVQYVAQTNRGVSAARNRGIHASKGEYLVFLDADDHLLPNHFADSLEGFRQCPSAALVCGTYRLFGSATRNAKHDCEPRPDSFGTLLRWNFIGPPHVAMFRREIVSLLGGFQEGACGCEDYDLYLRIARRHPIHCHHRLVAEYRRHESQMSQQWDVMLSVAVPVLRSQRPFLHTHPQYKDAYREGLSRWRSNYGEPLVWRLITHVRALKWTRAFSDFWTLLVYHPAGLLLPVWARLKSLGVSETSIFRFATAPARDETIMVRTLDGTIRLWNKGGEQMYGWSPDESVGQISHHLLRTCFPKPLQDIEAELLDHGQWEGTLTHTRRDGTTIKVTSRWELQRTEYEARPIVLEVNNMG